MQLFWEICKRSFQRQMSYRAAMVAGLVTNFFFGLLRIALLLALYDGRESVAGMTQSGVVTYAVMTQAIIAYISIFGWYELMNSVYTGEIAADLLRPMNYFLFWMAQDFGRAIVALLLRGVLLIIPYGLLYELIYPTSVGQWGVFALVLVLGWLVSFAYRFAVNLTAFWSPRALGIGRFFFVVSWFASGFLMPLRLMPEWVGRVAYLTPFPYLVDVPVELFLGIRSGAEIGWLIVNQLMWAAGLILLGQLLLRAGVKRLVILGG